MTVVALSASYGAGGAVIGPAVAEKLEVPFLDRAIPVRVAERLDVPVDDAVAHEEQPGEGWLERALRGFIGTDATVPAPLPADAFTTEDFRRATEEVLLRQAATGNGVILGRAAVIVLRGDPRVLRVRLDGPRERRIRQAMSLGQLDAETAQRALEHLDRIHEQYTRQLYGVDLSDPTLYHMVLDSTVISIDACVELIVTAARSLG
jgi:hypothetical protein